MPAKNPSYFVEPFCKEDVHDIDMAFAPTAERGKLIKKLFATRQIKSGVYNSWDDFERAHAEYLGRLTMDGLIERVHSLNEQYFLLRAGMAEEYHQQSEILQNDYQEEVALTAVQFAANLEALRQKAINAGLIGLNDKLPQTS